MKVLYILMRTDLPSMNAGKAMAQASHASNQFIHHHRRSLSTEGWAEKSTGFGTVLVLGATYSELNSIITNTQNDQVVSDRVVDTTYPYVVSNEIVSLISKSKHTFPPVMLENGNSVCVRREVTCAYIFGEKDDISHYVSNLSLHP